MYLPYCGIFNKIKSADIFVFLDDVQYSNQYYYNRNRIKTPNKEMMLTIPIKKSFKQPLNEVCIDNNILWCKKHLKSLIANYNKAPFFQDYLPFFEDLYGKTWDYLNDINIYTMNYFMEQLDINKNVYLSSDLLNSNGLSGTNRIIDICQKLNATEYLSGASGKDYLQEDLFVEAGIKLTYQDYDQLPYPQVYGDFVPYLSIIDLLFNTGVESANFI